MTNYNKKMYVIDDLDFALRVDSKFKIEKTGEEISFLDYYVKQWKAEIKDKNQFLIKCVDKKTKKVFIKFKDLVPNPWALLHDRDDW